MMNGNGITTEQQQWCTMDCRNTWSLMDVLYCINPFHGLALSFFGLIVTDWFRRPGGRAIELESRFTMSSSTGWHHTLLSLCSAFLLLSGKLFATLEVYRKLLASRTVGKKKEKKCCAYIVRAIIHFSNDSSLFRSITRNRQQ